MRKQMAKILTAVLLLGTLTDVSTAKAVAPKLNKSKLTLYIGSNYTLKVKKASGKVKWTSGKKSVATVSSKGKVVAKKAGIEAGMCGEAAGNPCMIPLLLSFGLDEFSVSPSNVLETRKNIASWSIREADEVTTSVMAMCTEKEVANYLSDYIAAKEQRSGFASQTRRI